MPTITSLSKLFITAQEGFTTTLSSSISSGATTIPLNSVAGYTDGSTIALVVDPADPAKKQVVVGDVDSSGSQLINAVWTEGTNQAHSAGATVVDYVTATHQAAMAKGAKVSLNDDGTLKDGIVTTAKIADGAITNAKLSTTTGELGGAWQDWTPTTSGGYTLGNGTIVAKYTQVGKTVMGYFIFTLGSTSTMGTAIFSAPVTPSSNYVANKMNIGFARFDNGGAGNGGGFVRIEGSSNIRAVVAKTNTTYATEAGVGSTVPFTWAAGDSLHISFTYEAA